MLAIQETEDRIRADLLDGRIVGVELYGSELRELRLHTGVVIRFRWPVGTGGGVGLDVVRRPGRDGIARDV